MINEDVDVTKLYQNDRLGLKRIAKIAGISPSGVRKRLVRAGVYRGTSTGVKVNGNVPSTISQETINPEVPAPTLDQWALAVGTRLNLQWQTDGASRILSGGRIILPGCSSLYAPIDKAWGMKVRLSVELNGYANLQLILGDSGGDVREMCSIRGKVQTFELSKIIGQRGYVRLDNPGFENYKLCLVEAFVEIET